MTKHAEGAGCKCTKCLADRLEAIEWSAGDPEHTGLVEEAIAELRRLGEPRTVMEAFKEGKTITFEGTVTFEDDKLHEFLKQLQLEQEVMIETQCVTWLTKRGYRVTHQDDAARRPLSFHRCEGRHWPTGFREAALKSIRSQLTEEHIEWSEEVKDHGIYKGETIMHAVLRLL
jgi:hypothetical protein